MVRKIAQWLIVCMLLICTWPFLQPNAAASLLVEAEIGFDNTIKYDTAVPLHITITNNGPNFEGNFVIQHEATYSLGANVVYPIQLATGESAVLHIVLDSYSQYFGSRQRPDTYFALYEGGYTDGTAIDFEGDKTVYPTFLDYQDLFVLTISDRDSLQAVQNISSATGKLVKAVNQSATQLPTDARALNMVSTIVFDDGAYNALNEQQKQVVQQYMQTGGTVIIGANEKLESSPLIISQQPVDLSVAQLKLAFKTDKELVDATVQQATVETNSTVMARVDDHILAAKQLVGDGELIQLAFPVEQEVLADTIGYRHFIGNLLPAVTGTEQGQAMSNVESWASVNELFPSFKFSPGWIIALLVVYILLVGPVLYAVLKKYDKREQMWLYVPLISVIFSLAFFMFGAKDRLTQPQTQEMTLYEVQYGQLAGTYTQALLSNKSGDFKWTLEGNTSAVGQLKQLLNEVEATSVLQETTDGQKTFTLQNMNYWSVQSFAGQTTIPSDGLEAELTLKNGRLTGQISNHLPVDLQGVAIYSGTDVYDLMPIKAGEVVPIDIKLKTKLLLGATYQYIETIDTTLSEKKLQALQETAVARAAGKQQAMLFGWTEQSLLPVTYEGKSHADALSGFMLPLQVETKLEGEMAFSTADFTVDITPNDFDLGYAYIENQQTLETSMGEGTYTVDYQLLSQIDSLDFTFNQLSVEQKNQPITVAVLNKETDQFEDIEGDWQSTAVTDYLKNNKLTLQVKRTVADDGQSVILPQIELQGVAK